MRRRLLPVLPIVVLLAAGCGGDDEGGGGGGSSERTATSDQPTETVGADLTDTTLKPEIPELTGAPPRKLDVDEIVKGKGRGAREGDALTVQYVGVSFSTGEQFDASWDKGEPFQFALGQGEVIPGWDAGLTGMRKGGRRQLTIPPDLAYGAQGSPPAIGPNETLVFVIDLVGLR